MKMKFFQPMDKKQEVALIGAVLFVGLVAVRGWVLEPHLKALRASQQYEAAMDAYEEKSDEINSELQAKHLWLNKLVSERTSMGDMVFTADKAEEFLSDLEAFCAEMGCTIGSLQHVGEDRQEDSPIVARTTALMVQGGYSDIIKLITKLKSRSQRVSIESLSLKATVDPRTVACRVVITIYVNLDKESGGHEETQLSQ